MAGIGATPDFEKLNKGNYASWKINMKAVLQYADCWDFVAQQDVPEPPGNQASSRAVEEYNRRKRHSKVLILLNCERPFQRIVENAANAHEAWRDLKKLFEPKNGLRMVRVLRDFTDIKYDSESKELISVFVERFKEKLEELREQEMKFSDAQQAYLLIRDLPESFNSVVERVCLIDSGKLTLKLAAEMLIEHEVRRKERGETGGNSNELMQINRSSRGRPYRVQGQDNRSQGPKYKSQGSVSENNDKHFNKIKCYECSGYGHIKRSCPNLRKSAGKNQNKYDSQGRQNYNRYNKVDDGINILLNISCGVIQEKKIAKLDIGNTWIYDSGATSHFCKSRNLFDSFREVNIPVRLADSKCQAVAKGTGTIKLKLCDEEGNLVNCILENVYYIPSLHTNILSGLKIAKNGFITEITRDKLTIRKDGRKFAAYNRRSQYFEFEPVYDTGRTGTNNIKALLNTAETWHRRMGHIHYNGIKNMLKAKSAKI